MRSRQVFMVVLVVGVVGADHVRADPPKELSDAAKRELKTLDGKWRVVRFMHSDRETTPGTGDDAVVVVLEGKTIDFDGSAAGVVVDLDPTTAPKCLDFTARVGSGVFREGTTYESVFKLDGDTLTWAIYTGRGKNRPVSFEKPADDGVMVMVLSRIEE